VERALIQFSGSIVCISHDRHFLNNVTNLTCEVGNGGIRLFKGNYDYYDWKKQEIKETKSDIPKVKTQSKGKPNYKKRKKVRNRLSWIDKRFYTIENELEIQRSIIQDPENGRDFELLQKTLEKMTDLESEYLGLMSEKEILMNKS